MIPYTSAHSRKMKMAVLVEEGLRNHTRGLEWERSRKVMEDWSRKLRRSGYPATMRHEVIKAAVDRYERRMRGRMRGSGRFTAPGAGRRRRGGGRRS